MRQPPIFSENRVDVMHKDEGEKGSLRGHVAISNPLFRETDGPFEVLTAFQGPQTYVTPAWYASKKEHGKVVPTWNYVVVHARGSLSFTRDTPWLMRHLRDLTSQHESHRPEPWSVSDAPAGFVEKQLKALVGFEIVIQELQGTWKVSQNKSLPDWNGVRDGLGQSDDADARSIGGLVEERARHTD